MPLLETISFWGALILGAGGALAGFTVGSIAYHRWTHFDAYERKKICALLALCSIWAIAFFTLAWAIS